MGSMKHFTKFGVFLLCVTLVFCNDDGFVEDGETTETPSNGKVIFGSLIYYNLILQEFKPGKFENPALDLSNVYFVDFFNDPNAIGQRWKISTAKKDGLEEALAKYDGVWGIALPSKLVQENDYGLLAKSKAKHHAIAVAVPKPIDFKSDELVVQ